MTLKDLIDFAESNGIRKDATIILEIRKGTESYEQDDLGQDIAYRATADGAEAPHAGLLIIKS